MYESMLPYLHPPLDLCEHVPPPLLLPVDHGGDLGLSQLHHRVRRLGQPADGPDHAAVGADLQGPNSIGKHISAGVLT